MTGRRMLAALAAIVLLGALAGGAASCRRTLLLNNARYLMHQGRWDEARARLERAETLGAQPQATALALARVAAATGDMAEAESLLRVAPGTGEALFLAAAVAFELNDRPRADALFAQALAAEVGPVYGVRRQIAEAAVTLNPPEGREPSDSPLEATLWNALGGLAHLRAAAFGDAAPPLRRAVALGTRNRDARHGCATALAALGEFAAARRVADMDTSTSEFYLNVAYDAVNLADTAATATMALADAERARGNRWLLTQAALWAQVMRAQDLGTTPALETALGAADAMLRQSPGSLPAAMLRADLLDALGMGHEAWAQCQAVMAAQPSLSAALRAAVFADDERALADAESEFAAVPGVVCVIAAADLASTCATRGRQGLALLTACAASGGFDTPADGTYEIAVIARGDRAFGLSPLAALSVDGKPAGEIYIARDGWDCYPVRTTLTKGRHEFLIRYVNNSERLRSPDEDRNLYLRSVMVARAGAR